MSDTGAAPTAITPARDRMIAALFLMFWTAVTILQQWNHWPQDLAAVYIAGWLWQSGDIALIYDAPRAFFGGQADSWFPVMERMGIGGRTAFPYVYPPIWAVLTAPLTTLLSAQGFANLVTIVQVPALAGSVWLAGRLFRPARMPHWLWAAIGVAMLSLSIQSHVAIYYNQPTITVAFLTLLAFERAGAGRPIVAGAALALAAAMKLSPAAFALLFLIDRQYRAFAAFALIGGALGLLSIALAGWPMHVGFLASLDRVSSAAFLNAINVSVRTGLLAAGSLLGFMEPVDPRATEHIYRDLPGWLGPMIAVAAFALIAWVLFALRDTPGPIRRSAGLLMLSVILALFGPLGWLHYYLLPMFLLPGIIGFLPPLPAGLLLGWIWLPSLAVVFARIEVLPWPIANYTWIMAGAWLALVFVLSARLRAGID